MNLQADGTFVLFSVYMLFWSNKLGIKCRLSLAVAAGKWHHLENILTGLRDHNIQQTSAFSSLLTVLPVWQ